MQIGRVAAESTDTSWNPSFVHDQNVLFKLCRCDCRAAGQLRDVLRDVLQRDPGYYGWMMNGDFPRYTKLVLKEEMEAMKAG